MASWIDFMSLAATLAVVGGTVYGIIRVIHVINDSWAATKESLKTKGLNVSRTGISVKTSRRFDREDYMDATHRGLVKVAGASSFRKGEKATTDSSQGPPKMERDPSDSSGSASGKKKGIFKWRK